MRKKDRQAPVYTEVTRWVSCAMSPTGKHPVKMVFLENGLLVHFKRACDGNKAAIAAMQLECILPTCFVMSPRQAHAQHSPNIYDVDLDRKLLRRNAPDTANDRIRQQIERIAGLDGLQVSESMGARFLLHSYSGNQIARKDPGRSWRIVVVSELKSYARRMKLPLVPVYRNMNRYICTPCGESVQGKAAATRHVHSNEHAEGVYWKLTEALLMLEGKKFYRKKEAK